MDYKKAAAHAKTDSFLMATLDEATRNRALEEIAEALEKNKEAIFSANREDLAAGADLAGPLAARLKFDEHKLEDVVRGIHDLTRLPDPLFRVQMKRELDEGLVLTRTTCPIGVIGVVFESRPDALVQISGLCIKSGNCVILKGGSEAKHTNKALFDVIHAAGVKAGLPSCFAVLVEDRAAVEELLSCDESIDLIIPRGGNAFVRHIMETSKIPVMGHADGICHIYVDKAADLAKAVPIIVDSKTQYPAACNAMETLLIHKDVADDLVACVLEASPVEIQVRQDEYKEFLDYIMTVRRVDSLEEAVDHINRYGSHHTDCIITEDEAACRRFMDTVDSAGVYCNCSTRFADGFRYGFGAEVGISTGKMPPRGPVGLEGLVTYKYRLKGNGHIVADYAQGRRSFHFRDLK
ncbi:MAG: glutamate-5-semialdehyde dehydrogenase [Eubacteriales bacterium]|nr:glutamate-5-semialdehyde dehydrogenase [Eubacteriales bacterium]